MSNPSLHTCVFYLIDFDMAPASRRDGSQTHQVVEFCTFSFSFFCKKKAWVSIRVGTTKSFQSRHLYATTTARCCVVAYEPPAPTSSFSARVGDPSLSQVIYNSSVVSAWFLLNKKKHLPWIRSCGWKSRPQSYLSVQIFHVTIYCFVGGHLPLWILPHLSNQPPSILSLRPPLYLEY